MNWGTRTTSQAHAAGGHNRDTKKVQEFRKGRTASKEQGKHSGLLRDWLQVQQNKYKKVLVGLAQIPKLLETATAIWK